MKPSLTAKELISKLYSDFNIYIPYSTIRKYVRILGAKHKPYKRYSMNEYLSIKFLVALRQLNIPFSFGFEDIDKRLESIKLIVNFLDKEKR